MLYITPKTRSSSRVDIYMMDHAITTNIPHRGNIMSWNSAIFHMASVKKVL